MRNILTGGVLLMATICWAQTLTVIDAATGEPLAYVAVFDREGGDNVVTNDKGQADLTTFKGAASIEFQLLGYAPLRRSYFDLERSQFIVKMEEWALSLQQVVVSASRWRQARREVPSNVLSLRSSDVALQNPQTAADMLGASGAVFIQKSQLGGGSPMIRGFSTNRLLIAVDGVRMNTAIFRSGNLQNIISIDPFSTAGAEVLFGPGSVMYGSDAIGGVMAFRTLRPAFAEGENRQVSGQAAARFASANSERTFHFDAATEGARWSALTSLTYNHFGDQRMGRHGPDDYLSTFYVERVGGQDLAVTNPDPLVQRPVGFEMTHLMQKISFRPSGNWDLHYGLHYSTTTDVPRYDRLLRTRNGLPRSAEWHYGPQVWRMNHLEAVHRSSGILYRELSLHLAHQFFEESRIDRNFGDPQRRSRTERVNASSANLDLHRPTGDSGELYYGAEVVWNDVASRGIVADVATGEQAKGAARYPDSDWVSWGVYATWQRSLSEKWRTQAGLRYSRFHLDARFNTAFFPLPFTEASLGNGALTGSLGFVFFPSENWALSLNAATGYRSPNVDDIGKVFDSTPGNVVVPNPQLKAEYAWHAELGMARLFGRHLKLDAALFYTLLDDALVRRDFTLNGRDSLLYDGELSRIQAVQNAATARVYGLQLNAEMKLPAGFGCYGSLNLQKGEEELDDGSTASSRHAAPWFGAAHLTWQSYGLKMDFSARFNGKKDFGDLPPEEQDKAYLYALNADGLPHSPGWVTIDFKAMYQVTDAYTLSAGVDNLLDKRYRPYASGITAPGRNVILALRMGF